MTMERRVAIAIAALIAAQPAAAQTQDERVRAALARGAELHGRANAYLAQTGGGPGQCQGYVGKPVTPTGFGSLVQRLGGAGPKGEYETTAAARARQAAAGVSGPVTVVVPIDRNYLRYDADAGAMNVLAGAFSSGSFSSDVAADVRAEIAVFADKSVAQPRTAFRVGSTERPLGTEQARNVLGTVVTIRDIERNTLGLSLDGEGLFRSTQDTVATFKVPPAQAARVKGTLRAALVVVPEAPFLVRGETEGEDATMSRPVQYNEKATIVVATLRCGLVLDAQSRVLAATGGGQPE